MADSARTLNKSIYESFWSSGREVYASHPTSRHRQRFVGRCLRRERHRTRPFVFDYGCGAGSALGQAKRILDLDDENLAGCDLTEKAIELTQERFPDGAFHVGSWPELPAPFDIAICTEVIEHTTRHGEIIDWLFSNMRGGGTLILTTPGVPMDAPDESYGHVQHFVLRELREEIVSAGFQIIAARRWGFPFFTLQKWLTRRYFDRIKENVIDSPMSWKKRLVFEVAYRCYMVHDLIPLGPQIFISARKPSDETF